MLLRVCSRSSPVRGRLVYLIVAQMDFLDLFSLDQKRSWGVQEPGRRNLTSWHSLALHFDLGYLTNAFDLTLTIEALKCAQLCERPSKVSSPFCTLLPVMPGKLHRPPRNFRRCYPWNSAGLFRILHSLRQHVQGECNCLGCGGVDRTFWI